RRRNRPLLHQPRQILLNTLQSLLNNLRAHFPHHRRKPRRRAHLRDPRPHPPTPHNSHFLNRHLVSFWMLRSNPSPSLGSLSESLSGCCLGRAGYLSLPSSLDKRNVYASICLALLKVYTNGETKLINA